MQSRFPPGHYYSPLPDGRELAAEPRRSQVWPAAARKARGVDWRAAEQRRLCADVFAGQQRLAWPRHRSEVAPSDYAYNNEMYPPLDAWILEAMLRWLSPARVIEVGSGFSSLVSARVNREAFAGKVALTCIEPHPPEFLVAGVPGVSELVKSPVQDVPLERFERLRRNDVLFIDTSHVVKTGGDVVWLYNEVLPRLAPGVAVHMHDVFLPRDYPEPWVLDGWGWNEQYLVQSFLAFNREFEVLLGAAFMLEHHSDALERAFPELPAYASQGASSLWIRRVASAATGAA